MSVGLHGRDHVDWRRISDDQFGTETIGARDTLSAITGTPIDTVGIPFGGYNHRVIARLKQSGFREIYTSDGGHTSEGRRLRHRTSVRAEMSDAVVEAIINGRESPLHRIKRGLKATLKEYVV